MDEPTSDSNSDIKGFSRKYVFGQCPSPPSQPSPDRHLVRVLKVPYRILFPLIILFCLIGAYGVSNTTFDLSLVIFFGGVGYLVRKLDYEVAPLILAFVLGPQLEQSLRQSLSISKGSFTIFTSRPISAVALGFGFLLLLSNIFPYIKKRRQEYEKIEE